MAIWGDYDRTSPPEENYRIFKDAFARSGKTNYTIQFIANADHTLRQSPDGFTPSTVFAPGYAEAMTSWVQRVVQGETPFNEIIGVIPQQTYESAGGWMTSKWTNSPMLHAAVPVTILLLFACYFVTGIIRRIHSRRHSGGKARMQRSMRLAATAILFTLFGFYVFFGFALVTYQVGPVIFGRPVVWLLLQISAVTACLAVVRVVLLWKTERSTMLTLNRLQVSLLLAGFLLFVPWALYWHLFY